MINGKLKKEDVIVIVPVLPDCCFDCPMCSHNYEYSECVPLGVTIFGFGNEVQYFKPSEERLPICPLRVMANVIKNNETVEAFLVKGSGQ